MRSLIYFIFTLFSLKSMAQGPLVLGATGDVKDYRLFLMQNPNFVSWSTYQKDKLASNEAQENQLFEIADIFDQEPHRALSLISELRTRGPLSVLSIQFLYDLSQRKLSNKYSGEIGNKLRRLNCEMGSLISSEDNINNCPEEEFIFLNPTDIASYHETILVESVPLKRIAHLIKNKARYNWTVLRDDQKPLSLQGSYQEFILFKEQVRNQTPLTNGSCHDFKLLDSSNESFSIFFSPDCIRDKNWLPSPRIWPHLKSPWVLGAGVLVSITTLIYLSDKNLKISIPF